MGGGRAMNAMGTVMEPHQAMTAHMPKIAQLDCKLGEAYAAAVQALLSSTGIAAASVRAVGMSRLVLPTKSASLTRAGQDAMGKLFCTARISASPGSSAMRN